MRVSSKNRSIQTMNIVNKYVKIFSVLLVLTVASPSSAFAVANQFHVTGPTANDVDNISPTVLNFEVAESGDISSLEVQLRIDATGNGGNVYWDNMFVQISHAGIDVILMDLQGDRASHVSSLIATFSDSGSDLGSALQVDGPTTGTFNSLQSLAAFDGVPLAGVWTLTLWDDTVPFDGTDLVEFSLIGETTIVQPIAIPTMSNWGIIMLIGLFVMFAFRRNL